MSSWLLVVEATNLKSVKNASKPRMKRLEKKRSNNNNTRNHPLSINEIKKNWNRILAETETSLVNQLEMEVEKTLNVDAIISEALVASQVIERILCVKFYSFF